MTDFGDTFTVGDLRSLLEELSMRLSESDASAQLFVVGGAAMALKYDAGRLTQDIDAVFSSPAVVRGHVEAIAYEHGLPLDWLNDAVKGFLPGEDPDASVVFESESLLVKVASAEFLLAMKLFSARASRDRDDAVNLYMRCGMSSATEALTLLSEKYPARLLTPRHEYVCRQVAERASSLAVARDAGNPVVRDIDAN